MGEHIEYDGMFYTVVVIVNLICDIDSLIVFYIDIGMYQDSFEQFTWFLNGVNDCDYGNLQLCLFVIFQC